MKKDLRFSEKEEDRCKEVEEEEEDGSLDRLLLVQSDLSSLVHQDKILASAAMKFNGSCQKNVLKHSMKH